MGLYTQNEAARVAVERELRVAGHKANGNGANGSGNGSLRTHMLPGATSMTMRRCGLSSARLPREPLAQCW